MRCCVCYSDEKELGNCEVIECASGHATCAECFNEHVKVETAKGAGYVMLFVKREKRIEEEEEKEKDDESARPSKISLRVFFLSLFFSFVVRSKKKVKKRISLSSLFFPTITSSRFSLSLSLSLPRARITDEFHCFSFRTRFLSSKNREREKRNGNIMCPMFSEAVPKEQRCPAKAFDDRDVARFCEAETFNEYNRQKLALREKQIVEQVEKDFEERLAREKQRAMETSSAEEKLRLAKEHVIEKVLTLSCPRCEQAFVDFDGCFALKCGRCQAGFCAYCLADCGRDAHAHIGGCELGKQVTKWAQKNKTTVNARGHPPGTFGSPAAFDESQRLRRLRDLTSYFENKEEKFVTQVLDALEKELKDLNITKKDVQKSITALRKSRNKPQKKNNAPAGGRANRGMVMAGAADALENALLGFMNQFDNIPVLGARRENQRIEEARRRQALEEERKKVAEEKRKRMGRINDAFGAMAKVRDLEAKYERDKDAAIKASLEDFRKKIRQEQPQMVNEKPGEPVVIDLASSGEKPNPNAGKLRAERRAKREREAAEAKRRIDAATKDNVIDLDLIESQQSPPPPSLFAAKPSSANRKRTASPPNNTSSAKKKRVAQQSKNSQEAIVID